MSAVLTKVEAVVQKVAQYAETITTAAAAATAAFDPSVLPVKWAAGYAAFAGATRVAREYVNKGTSYLPVAEKAAPSLLGEAEAVFKRVTAVPAEAKALVVAQEPVVPSTPVVVPVPAPLEVAVPAGPTGVPVAPVVVPLPEPPAPTA